MLWGWLGLTCDDEAHQGQHPCNLYDDSRGQLAYAALLGGLLLLAFYQTIVRQCLPETVAANRQIYAAVGASASRTYVPRPDSCCDRMVCIREREDLYCGSWTHTLCARWWSVILAILLLACFAAFVVRWKIVSDNSNLDIQLMHALLSINLAITGSLFIWLPPNACPRPFSSPTPTPAPTPTPIAIEI